jgi:hypothetical protein
MMWKQLTKIVLVAGSLDITAAFLQAFLSNGVSPGTVLRYIASGWFGEEAFSGGDAYLLFGLLVHFAIVFACSLAYLKLYPELGFLRKNIWFSAFLLAIAAWAVTTRVIIPLSRIETPKFVLSKVLVALAILYCCIGIPIAYFTARHYKGQSA